MNTYSDQRTDVNVFEVCDLSCDHATIDLDTIASSIHSGCDGIDSGGCVCGVRDVNLDVKIANGICVCNDGHIGGVHFVGCVPNSGHGGFNGIVSGVCCGCNGNISSGCCVCDCIVGGGCGGYNGIAGSGHGGCDGFASGSHVCGICNVDLNCGIASGIHATNDGCINNARTGSNAAININVSAAIVTFVDDSLCGGAGFVLL